MLGKKAIFGNKVENNRKIEFSGKTQLVGFYGNKSVTGITDLGAIAFLVDQCERELDQSGTQITQDSNQISSQFSKFGS